MSNRKSPYFALEGGLNYKAVLKHFRDQAEGKKNINFIHTNGSQRKQKGKSSLVVLDLADPDSNKKATPDQQPKIEVIDPTEAERKRALGQLAKEASEILENSTNQAAANINGHSPANSRQRQNKKRKALATQKIISKKVKRAKDIFDV